MISEEVRVLDHLINFVARARAIRILFLLSLLFVSQLDNVLFLLWIIGFSYNGSLK